MLQSMGMQRVEYDLVPEQQQIHEYGMSFHLFIYYLQFLSVFCSSFHYTSLEFLLNLNLRYIVLLDAVVN